ncbi:MAG: LLM class F420-dependent oxidoreductase, partial [Actinomycetes bacterium]
QDLYLDRRHRDAMAAVPQDFLTATSLLGTVGQLVARFAELAAAGVTTCTLAPYGRTVEEKLAALTAAAEAFDRAGVG